MEAKWISPFHNILFHLFVMVLLCSFFLFSIQRPFRWLSFASVLRAAGSLTLSKDLAGLTLLIFVSPLIEHFLPQTALLPSAASDFLLQGHRGQRVGSSLLYFFLPLFVLHSSGNGLQEGHFLSLPFRLCVELELKIGFLKKPITL